MKHVDKIDAFEKRFLTDDHHQFVSNTGNQKSLNAEFKKPNKTKKVLSAMFFVD